MIIFTFRFGWFSDPDPDPGLEGYHRLGSPFHAAFRYAKQRPPHHARADRRHHLPETDSSSSTSAH
ncbi:hypothetical protein Patl1_27967 [Pistacia atlantica]|uniref:Uncharacterized protein n=1 Tax=Pistacia atlantica TaxID=434234 RepID=A0ACC1BBP9_9ROSI|nr:hypothetical protein Patl1_27967 [Pistacia atlantica]